MSYDPSNDELYALFEECKRDPARFARVVIAQNAQHEYHRGIVPNTSAEQYKDIHLHVVK